MAIYFTRHGETTMNLANRISGVTDCDLTEKGRAQARELAERCREIGGIDMIIASPLKRAQETARAVSEAIHVPVLTDVRLREWDYGSYENMPNGSDGFPEAKREFGVRMRDGGESLLQLAHRVYGFIDEVAEKYRDRTVLCVCHGGVCRVAETYFHDMTTDVFSHFFMGNCELRRYTI